jgi:hypothetical protein
MNKQPVTRNPRFSKIERRTFMWPIFQGFLVLGPQVFLIEVMADERRSLMARERTYFVTVQRDEGNCLEILMLNSKRLFTACNFKLLCDDRGERLQFLFVCLIDCAVFTSFFRSHLQNSAGCRTSLFDVFHVDNLHSGKGA